LIKLASGFEAATRVRKHNLPTFAPTVPFTHIAGTTLKPTTQRAMPAASGKGQPAPSSNASRPLGKELKHPRTL
jgi:hypothetical protein